MKKSKIVVAVGIVLIAIGAFFAIGSVMPGTQSFSADVPSGSFYVVQVSGVSGGKFTASITTEVTSAVYYFDEAEYNDFRTYGSGQAIYNTAGTSVTFTQTIPDTASYYVVVYPDSSSSVDMTLDLSGILIWGLVLASVLIIVGAIAIAFGVRMGKKERAATPIGPPIATDVTVFDNAPKRP